jgi:hypothetical protein
VTVSLLKLGLPMVPIYFFARILHFPFYHFTMGMACWEFYDFEQ